MKVEVRSQVGGSEAITLICNKLREIPLCSDINEQDIVLQVQADNGDWAVLDPQRIKFTYNK